MNKIKTIVLCIVVLVVIALSFFLTRQREDNLSSVDITPTPLPTIPISEIRDLPSNPVYSSEPPAVFRYTIQPPSYPDTLSTYTYQFSTDLFTQVKNYAKSLGFVNPPEEIATGFWYFRNGQSLLKYNEQSRALSFSTNDEGANQTSPFPDEESVFRQLRAQNLFYSYIKTSFKQRPQQTVSEGGPSLRSRRFVDVFYFLNNQVPFIFDTINSPAALFHVTDSFGVSAFTVHIPPERITPKDTVKIVTAGQVLQLLNSGKGGLISVSDKDKENFGSIPSFSSVEIQELTLLYLLLENERTLVPVFRVKGIGRGTVDQDVEYFVRAS